MSENWNAYWNSTDKSYVEQRIQSYKIKKGYARLLKGLPEISNNGRVLEVGAGKAWLSWLLRMQGWQTTAIDLNHAVIKANSLKVDNYLIADMYKLPFKENSFDLVMSCGLIEHFDLDKVERILLEMRRVGKSLIVWFPTCGLNWRILWSVRNFFGGNVLDETFKHREEKVRELFVSLGLRNIKSGLIKFAHIFPYIYVYGK